MDITELLAFGVKNKASDLHLSSGLPPMIRVHGDVRRINLPAMEHKDVHAMVYDIMNDGQRKIYEETLECDFSFEVPNLARFRVNAFNQQRGAGAVFRTIPSKVLSLEELGCPKIFKDISEFPRGIVLVTGPTGSGKSTTLAAMINHINENDHGHILTVEDPIEFVHESKKCLINQREVGPHTLSFNNALRSALREDPDVILVGEMRDLETIRLALTGAETGHLVFGTLHTSSAAKTVDRIVDVFPAAEKEMVRSMLSESLRAVISQTLLKTKDGTGRVAAHEIMLGTPAIRNLIRENKVAQMYSSIQTSSSACRRSTRTCSTSCAATSSRPTKPAARPPTRTPSRASGFGEQGWKEDAMERDQALKFMHDLLRLMAQKNGSDLFITANFPPAIKIDGKVMPVSNQALNAQHTAELARAIMNDRQAAEFESSKECNFAISPSGIGRFRVNALVQQGRVAVVCRTINMSIPTLDELGLPPVLKDIAMTKRGLVIFVGGTGTGKTTSLAALVDYRNQNSHGHIITIEDPVEYIHEHKNCIVTQREVGVDTDSWEAALKNTLRQAPDVILMGEIRDRETMDYAVAFAETGHLCLATLHANSANQAIDRIINFFPEERGQQLLMDLSLNLRGLVSQRLLPKKDGKGRVAAIEVMLNSPLISDLIFKGEVQEIKEIMKKSRELGMQTFDQALFDHYEGGRITYEDALRNADSINDLRLQIKLHGKESKDRDLTSGIGHLDIV